MIQRELTMTVICMCENQYGQWRPRCPACGTATPFKAREEVRINKARMTEPRREREPHPTECDFCHRRGATETSGLCAQLVHKNCLTSHTPRCVAFQAEREALLEATP